MIALLNQVKTVASGLTSGHLFSVDEGPAAEIAYRVGDYPYKGDATGSPPIGVVLPRSFTPGPGRRTVRVEIAYTLYAEDLATALVDLERLTELLAPMTERGTSYAAAGWKLDQATGFFGDRETGAHPDPNYYLFYTLDFTRA